MALQFPSDLPPEQRQKLSFDFEVMLSGLLMGFAVLAFAACLLFVLNGKAEKWLLSFSGKAAVPKAAGQSQAGKSPAPPKP